MTYRAFIFLAISVSALAQNVRTSIPSASVAIKGTIYTWTNASAPNKCPANGVVGAAGTGIATAHCRTDDGANWIAVITSESDGSTSVPSLTTTLTNPSLGTGYLSTTKTAGSGGTTANTIVKIDSTGNVVTASTSDVGILGIVVSTASAAATVEVATRGIVQCVADNTTVIGNTAIVGTSTGGRCRDSGQTAATSIANSAQIVGKVLSVATVGNLVSIQLYGPGHYGTQILGGTVTDDGTTVTVAGRNLAVGAGTLQAGITASDPGCTTTAHIGKVWFDITTTTTVEKHCWNVAGTLTWHTIP